MNFHGGNIYDYNNIKFDFSSNINPLGVPDNYKKALCESIGMFTKYPDIEYRELIMNIKRYLEIDEESNILLGNGAVELIHSIIANSGFDTLYSISPTFSEYKKAAQNSNIDYYDIPCYYENYSELDINTFLRKVKEKSLVILCNPNNPTGYFINNQWIKYIAEKLYEKSCNLIIDEAFIEFTDDYPQSSFISKLHEHPNVSIIRAVTKFFGMPGIRLGYAVTGDKKLWTRVRQNQQPWNINAAAIIAGCTVLEDMEYIDKSRNWIKAERAFLYGGLSNIKHLKVTPSKANFHLLKIEKEGINAYNLRDLLVNESILIRIPKGFNSLTANHFRLAVLDRKANLALLSALSNIFGKDSYEG